MLPWPGCAPTGKRVSAKYVVGDNDVTAVFAKYFAPTERIGGRGLDSNVGRGLDSNV